MNPAMLCCGVPGAAQRTTASSSNCPWVAGWCQFDIWWAHRVAQRRRSTRESVQQTRALINERCCGGFRCQSSGQLRRASCRRPLNRYSSAGRLEIGTGSMENMRFGARRWNCVERQTPREKWTRYQCCCEQSSIARESTLFQAQRSCSGSAGPHRSRRTRQVPCLALRAR